MQHLEYANKFKQIIENNSEFAVRMLDLCRNQNEAELILINKMLPPEVDFINSRLPFPILEGALINRNTKFVAHDYSQETLREKMVHSDVNEDILPWNSTKMTGQYLYMLMALIFMPLFVIFKVVWDLAQVCRNRSRNHLRRSEIKSMQPRKKHLRFLFSFFTFPLNRSLGYLFSFILHFAIVIIWIFGHDTDSKAIRIPLCFLWIISLAGIVALLKNVRQVN